MQTIRIKLYNIFSLVAGFFCKVEYRIRKIFYKPTDKRIIEKPITKFMLGIARKLHKCSYSDPVVVSETMCKHTCSLCGGEIYTSNVGKLKVTLS